MYVAYLPFVFVNFVLEIESVHLMHLIWRMCQTHGFVCPSIGLSVRIELESVETRFAALHLYRQP